MKYIIIATLLSLCLFNSCTNVPNYYVQNSHGFEVDTEATAMIISSRMMDEDVSYEDELVRISDMLSNIDEDRVITEEELRSLFEEALDCVSSENRKKNVIGAFEILIGYYGNVVNGDTYSEKDSYATIQRMSSGIIRAVEYHWVTYSEK